MRGFDSKPTTFPLLSSLRTGPKDNEYITFIYYVVTVVKKHVLKVEKRHTLSTEYRSVSSLLLGANNILHFSDSPDCFVLSPHTSIGLAY